jgi:hypothetical protein
VDTDLDLGVIMADSDYAAAVGPAETVPVLYDGPFQRVGLYEGQAESVSPSCTMYDADVELLSISHGTRLTILRQSVELGEFEIYGIQADGTGMTRLLLTTDF